MFAGNDIEIMLDTPMAKRGMAILSAMSAAACPPGRVTRAYRGTSRLLMMYGAGSATRLPILKQHVKNGGHVASWDLGYWDRDESMRLSIDGIHPAPGLIDATDGPARREFVLREDADPHGPILLIGGGQKMAKAVGAAWLEWERAKLLELRAKHPGVEIKWRPKGKDRAMLPGTTLCTAATIEESMLGCRLVVCRTSNASVDACVAGVPASCEGGAGLALYGKTHAPTAAQRLDFLRALSWWNWAPSEAPAALAWIRKVTR